MTPYKGYRAAIWLNSDDQLLHGTVEGIRDTVHFAGRSVEELETAFRESVDAYLEICAEDGVDPEKPYSGKLAFRTSPDNHRKIADAAAASARSINQWMDEALQDAAHQVLSAGAQKIRQG